MTKRSAKNFCTKRWSAIKAFGLEVKAVHEEKQKVRDRKQRSTSNWNDYFSVVDTVEGSNAIGGSRDFNSDG